MNDTVPPLIARALSFDTADALLLDKVDIHLHAGEVLGIVGPNGAGKSTLLKTLAGVQQPSAGEVLLDGKLLASLPAFERARRLAYLEQRPFVQWPLSVQQVVGLGRLPFADRDRAYSQQAIDEALAATDTAALRLRNFHTLSEGEKVRVHLARILAGTPRIVLADEPIAALDPWHQLQVLDLLRAAAANGTGIALVLHDLQLAARYCDRLVVLDHGRIVASGAAREILTAELLASVWRLDASFDSATLRLEIHGRKS